VPNVNRNPAGILELLNLNLQGEFPRELASSILSTVELAPYFYEGLGWRQAQFSNNLTAVGTTTSLTVPQGELWALRGVGYRCENTDPPATFAASIRYRTPANQGVPFITGVTQSILLNQFYEIGTVFPAPILMNSGFAIQGLVNLISGVPVGGFTCTLTVLYHRLTLQ